MTPICVKSNFHEPATPLVLDKSVSNNVVDVLERIVSHQVVMTLRTILLFASMLLALGCEKGPPAPKTQAEFIEAYRSAYNAGDKAAVLALVKWDGVPDDLRKFSEQVLTLWIGKHQITTIEMASFEPDPELPQEIDGRKLESNLAPNYWLIAKNEGHEGYQNSKSTGSVRHAVGIDNGVLRFCGMRWVGP
jgi:hypothetical protein